MSAAGCEPGVIVAAGVYVPRVAVSFCFDDSAGAGVVGPVVRFAVGVSCCAAAFDGFAGAEAAAFGLAAGAGEVSVAAGGGGAGAPCAV